MKKVNKKVLKGMWQRTLTANFDIILEGMILERVKLEVLTKEMREQEAGYMAGLWDIWGKFVEVDEADSDSLIDFNEDDGPDSLRDAKAEAHIAEREKEIHAYLAEVKAKTRAEKEREHDQPFQDFRDFLW